MTADTLYEGILASGSSEVLLVSTLAAASLKWNGMKTTPFAVRLDTSAFTVMEIIIPGNRGIYPSLDLYSLP